MKNFFNDNSLLQHYLRHPAMERIIALREGRFEEAAHYPFAPHDTADAHLCYRLAMEQLGALCGEAFAPEAATVDREGCRVEEGRARYGEAMQRHLERLTESGFWALSLPRNHEGLNFPTTLFVMATELIARADSSLACLWALQNCGQTIALAGNDEQRSSYLRRIAHGATCAMLLTEPNAGSDLQSARLEATFDEERQQWYLNGVKRFITNGDADLKLILARSEAGSSDGRGLSLFLHDKAWGGVTVRRTEHKLGIRGTATCELHFHNTPVELVGVRRMGLIKYVMALMNSARLGIGAQAVGIAEAALREAEQYAREREQFGKSIATLAPIQELLALGRARLEACRALLYETARMVDLIDGLSTKADLNAEELAELRHRRQLCDLYTPILKLMAGEYCNSICYDALQVHGGAGYMADFPIERLVRDARVVTIYEGTSQMQVVAALRHTMDGMLVEELHQLSRTLFGHGVLQNEKRRLAALVNKFSEAVRAVATMNGGSERHGRRLVECGGVLLMSLLLVAEAEREPQLVSSASLFVTEADSLLAAHTRRITALTDNHWAAMNETYNSKG